MSTKLVTNDPIPLQLVQGMTPEQKANFIQHYRATYELRVQIATILQDSLDGAIEEAEDDKLYTRPNWELKQADNRGYRRALRQAITLLTKEF